MTDAQLLSDDEWTARLSHLLDNVVHLKEMNKKKKIDGAKRNTL
jgi:hypothetical protein